MITDNNNEYFISFHLHIGQEVYYLYKDYPKRGYIEEIDISIKKMNPNENIIKPIIKYKIKSNWYNEDELWTNRKDFQKWIDDNFCYTKFIDTKENFCKWNDKKCFLLGVIERKNNKHPWKKKKIAFIFYIDEDTFKGYFRYVFYEDITDVLYEQTYLHNTTSDLMKTYGTNYIEDDIYNFVNYDGIKF